MFTTCESMRRRSCRSPPARTALRPSRRQKGRRLCRRIFSAHQPNRSTSRPAVAHEYAHDAERDAWGLRATTLRQASIALSRLLPSSAQAASIAARTAGSRPAYSSARQPLRQAPAAGGSSATGSAAGSSLCDRRRGLSSGLNSRLSLGTGAALQLEPPRLRAGQSLRPRPPQAQTLQVALPRRGFLSGNLCHRLNRHFPSAAATASPSGAAGSIVGSPDSRRRPVARRSLGRRASPRRSSRGHVRVSHLAPCDPRGLHHEAPRSSSPIKAERPSSGIAQELGPLGARCHVSRSRLNAAKCPAKA